MAWLNSDDRYFPGCLKIVAEIFRSHGQVNWIPLQLVLSMDYYGDVLQFGTFTGFSKQAFNEQMFGASPFAFGQFPAGIDFLEKIIMEQDRGKRLSTSFQLAGDYELWSRFFSIDILYGVRSPLGCYRKQSLQKTTDTLLYMQECARISSESSHKTFGGEIRRIMFSMRLHRFPFLKQTFLRLAGYTCWNMEKEKISSSASKWVVKSSKHL